MVSASLPRLGLIQKLERLNGIAGTPSTAFRINTNKFKGLELQLNQEIAPAAGLTQFWKTNLPPLRFHNDDFNFRVTKIKLDDVEAQAEICPVKLKVFGVEDKDSFELDCKGKPSDYILQEFVKRTGAEAVPEEEIPVLKMLDGAEIQRLVKEKKRSENH